MNKRWISGYGAGSDGDCYRSAGTGRRPPDTAVVLSSSFCLCLLQDPQILLYYSLLPVTVTGQPALGEEPLPIVYVPVPPPITTTFFLSVKLLRFLFI